MACIVGRNCVINFRVKFHAMSEIERSVVSRDRWVTGEFCEMPLVSKMPCCRAHNLAKAKAHRLKRYFGRKCNTKIVSKAGREFKPSVTGFGFCAKWIKA